MIVNSSAGTSEWARFCREAVDDRADSLQRTLLERLGVVDELIERNIAKKVRFEDVKEESRSAKGIHIFEVSDPISDDREILSAEQWEDIEFEVALDSGSQDHVCDDVDCPGYATEESPGSSRGQCFVVGDGGKLANMGQRNLNMEPLNDSRIAMSSCFQIARVTRPLMSVGKICDNGLEVKFTDSQAVVSNKEGVQICVFERKPGGLYLCKFRLKRPTSSFTRPR